jgi:hypothetical protein
MNDGSPTKAAATFSWTHCKRSDFVPPYFFKLRSADGGVNQSKGLCEQAVIPVADRKLSGEERANTRIVGVPATRFFAGRQFQPQKLD